ncbi:hypothetical protein Patl1_30850 [Pistacia atlantica]|uniref:Uncharacterized protein n=1 Tax=Pistacia atlantica TaxID=434234 RepID=A0ACC1AAJ7_9ROSI|nr:hypothetical protein Patl1_30850 [Pistacia atlantica]
MGHGRTIGTGNWIEREEDVENDLCCFWNYDYSCHLRSITVIQEKIMRVPYGVNKEYFRYSLFLVFCNRLTTSAVSAGSLLLDLNWDMHCGKASKKALNPVAPVYKYCLISVSNILTTTCQYEALKYVSFPVQTLAKCAKMIPVMVNNQYFREIAGNFSLKETYSSLSLLQIWGTIIMQKRYKGPDYLFAFLVTLGCSVFILFPAGSDISPYNRGRENTVWGVSLMVSYLGFDGFTSTFQDKLFKGYDMEIHNQIFYTAFCSCVLSFTGEFPVYLKSTKTIVVKNLAFGVLGSMMVLESVLASASVGFGQICLILEGHLLPAIDFVYRHNDCFFDILLLSTVATTSQFFISYTIRTFGALTFAYHNDHKTGKIDVLHIKLVSIMLSCVWFSHPLSWEQWIGSVIVFGSLYVKSFLRNVPKPQPPELPMENMQIVASDPVKGNP